MFLIVKYIRMQLKSENRHEDIKEFYKICDIYFTYFT